MLEERRQVAAGDVAVLVDRRRQHRPAVLAVPRRVVRAPAEERDAEWRPADDHGSRSRDPDRRRHHGPTAGAPEELPLDEPADHVLDGQVRLLDVLGVRARDRMATSAIAASRPPAPVRQ